MSRCFDSNHVCMQALGGDEVGAAAAAAADAAGGSAEGAAAAVANGGWAVGATAAPDQTAQQHLPKRKGSAGPSRLGGSGEQRSVRTKL